MAYIKAYFVNWARFLNLLTIFKSDFISFTAPILPLPIFLFHSTYTPKTIICLSKIHLYIHFSNPDIFQILSPPLPHLNTIPKYLTIHILKTKSSLTCSPFHVRLPLSKTSIYFPSNHSQITHHIATCIHSSLCPVPVTWIFGYSLQLFPKHIYLYGHHHTNFLTPVFTPPISFLAPPPTHTHVPCYIHH